MPKQSATSGVLGPLLTEQTRLNREAVKRRKPYDEQSISAAQLPEFEGKGWQRDRDLKRLIKVRKEKSRDERLENRFWMLLYRLGYPEINEGRSFSVAIERKGASIIRKQIDVFAKDDETVIVAECKCCEKMSRRTLQKDVEEFANLKGPIANAVRKHYGDSPKLKIIWLFVTENVIWSSPDKQRAAGENIQIITERELRYYVQIAEHLGKAARYQFLAEFLKDQAIPGLSNRAVPAIKGKLGGRHFFAFVSTPRHLLKIAFVNHRSLNDPDGAPTYQRLVSRGRLKAVGDYIKNGGYFPNNILLSFTKAVRFDKVSKDAEADVTYGQLYLPDTYRSAWIIDGQHRLYGFAPIDDKFLDQNVIVVSFERLPKTEEANLFVTINHEQKPVPKHLLDDLEGELKWGSEVPAERVGAISARLINYLNGDVGDPFYNRVVQQGIASTSRTSLTIPALKDALKRSGLIGRPILGKSTLDLGPLSGKTDSESLDRARTALNQFFNTIRDANVIEWESGREGHLCTNVGVQAYILLLAELIKYWEANTASDPREMEVEEMLVEIEEYLSPILELLRTSSAVEIKERFQVPFGSGGPPEYFFRLCKIVKSDYPDFEPEGLANWEAERSHERIQEADKKLKEIVADMRHQIFETFKAIHGVERDAYWEQGVVDKGIKTAAYTKSLDYVVADRLPLETYLEVVDMKKIIETRENWPLFKPTFNIPEPGDKGVAKNTKWMIRINELRRISAHPAKERHYKVEDFEYIDFVYEEFGKRWRAAKDMPLPEAPEIAFASDG